QINNAWQQQIHITGSGTGGTICPTLTPHSNGFDATLNNNASMFTYNASGAANARWTSISNTNATNLTPGTGYRVIVRGDRNTTNNGCSLLDGSATNASAVTLSATGAVGQGNVNVNIATGFNLIGNPYPSAVDFGNSSFLSGLQSASISKKYWAYNPTNAAGTYTVVDFSLDANNPTITSAGGATNLRYIASGQAFFVERTSGSGMVTSMFTESYKASTSPTAMHRGSNANNNSSTINYLAYVKGGLRRTTDTLNLSEMIIRTVAHPDASNSEVTGLDALSMDEGSHQLASMKHNQRIAIQTRSSIPVVGDTIALWVRGVANTNYELRFEDPQQTSAELWLID
ncbi:MAG TPA: hypothetical protein DCL43_08390, partial [Chitinophagaceae bacterium]|nr:hypothetical protein [Chitinophagaceae bacterium]